MVADGRREHDWGFVAEDPRGALNGAVSNWCFWWDDWCQHRFAQLWGHDAEDVADDLADHYEFAWPWLASRALPVRACITQSRIEALCAEPRVVERANGTNPRVILDVSTVWGSFHVVRHRRTWPGPSLSSCAVCGAEFWSGELPVWTFVQFGIGRYCRTCCFRARTGTEIDRWTPEKAGQAIRELTDALGSIPRQAYAFEALPIDAPPHTRDRWMRALCAMPNVAVLKAMFDVGDWLGVLQAVGLVGETRRTGRGTWCRAEDGHLCRSLLERSIDDWFHRNGIHHECEPHWPTHPAHNPRGLKRADWLLDSGAYVECTGMMEDPNYLAKIKAKQHLAAELGLRLYLVGPTDLYALNRIFAAEHPRCA